MDGPDPIEERPPMLEKIKAKLMPLLIVSVLAGGVAVIAMRGESKNVTVVDVRVPQLSPVALEGRALFKANCASCHGENAGGSDKAPPLVHKIYNPGHHADEAFIRAAQMGVRSHHWNFGDMPKIGTPKRDVLKIVRYIRELQRANGIFYQPHSM